ncbi:MAG: AAA family ATPase, partial [Chloroflexota bacterium]
MTPIFFLAGAPAVGKSTAARALAAKFPKSMHISVDTLRDMVISGAIHPSGNWSPGLVEQLSLARASAMQMAISYNQAGFVVIIDDFWDPHGR